MDNTDNRPWVKLSGLYRKSDFDDVMRSGVEWYIEPAGLWQPGRPVQFVELFNLYWREHEEGGKP